MLLTGAGLMLRSLWNLQRIDLGFNPDRVLTMRLALPAAQYDTPEKVIGFYEQLLADVRATCRASSSAGLLRLLPLAAPIGDWGLTIEGYHAAAGRQHARRLAGRDRRRPRIARRAARRADAG